MAGEDREQDEGVGVRMKAGASSTARTAEGGCPYMDTAEIG
jgi:hypothetical protein